MANLIYSVITSLDGYVADEGGRFEWAAPDEEVHTFINNLERPLGTYLYGRRMYDVMVYWETADAGADQPLVVGGGTRSLPDNLYADGELLDEHRFASGVV